jgi:gamma-glutamylcyclotransferase (GGCT)/AIG2-like uncharacterized protein YtfP
MAEADVNEVDVVPAAVFVYGTLRPGRANWAVAEAFCARHEPATLPGFGLYLLAYPVVAELPRTGHGSDPSAAGVRGDLLWLRAGQVGEALARLDAFEGVDHHRPDRSYYERVCTPVVTASGDRPLAWVYVPGADLRDQVDPAHRVAGDDWTH